MNPQTTTLTEKEFWKTLETGSDILSVVVRSHHLIENVLNESLSEALPLSDALEIGRISFLLKADFLVAFGILRKDIRPVFACMNTIRNRFAHNPNSEFSERDALDARNLLVSRDPPAVPPSFAQEQDSMEILRHVFWRDLCERDCWARAATT